MAADELAALPPADNTDTDAPTADGPAPLLNTPLGELDIDLDLDRT